MKMLVFFLLALLANVHASKRQSSSSVATLLSGAWSNELGSKMMLEADQDGTLSGTYASRVGDVNGTYALLGYYERDSSVSTPTLSFTVNWHNAAHNAHSTTSWTGFAHGKQLQMFWVLASTPDSDTDLWSATRLGKDTFSKQ